MSELDHLVESLELNKRQAERRDMALRLYKNPDFKVLILDGFCESDCARFARISAQFALSAEERADALASAQAAGHLMSFLSVTVQMGNSSDTAIRDLENEIEEVRAEDQDVEVIN